MALVYQTKFLKSKDSVLFIFVFAVPFPVHIVGLIKCLLNEKMNHQQTLIGRLLCDLHGLSLSPTVAYNVQGLLTMLTPEIPVL
jgi:hypothetical protein